MATFSSIPTQENPMVRGARQAPVNGVTESQTRMTKHTHTYTRLSHNWNFVLFAAFFLFPPHPNYDLFFCEFVFYSFLIEG